MEEKSVMTVLGIPGDSQDFPILPLLPLCNQRARMVKHGSIRPDGRPTYKGTQCDLMMHLSPLLMHLLSKRHVKEHVMSTEGASFSYSCTSSQMA